MIYRRDQIDIQVTNILSILQITIKFDVIYLNILIPWDFVVPLLCSSAKNQMIPT